MWAWSSSSSSPSSISGQHDSPPHVSFIAVVDFTEEAHWLYLTDSCSDLLGYEPFELMGRSALELVHPDELPAVKQIHLETIQQDKAAALAYLRLKHKDPAKGYILCATSRTVVYDVICGGISCATPGPRAFHNNATAQEVNVISQDAQAKQFEPPKKWSGGDTSVFLGNLGSPYHMDSPVFVSYDSYDSLDTYLDLPPLGPWSLPQDIELLAQEQPPTQSPRTMFILDRFSLSCPIVYCTNELLVSGESIIGTSFFDLVSEPDQDYVQQWIGVIKAWGVNDRGQPSDGGFGVGKFNLRTRPMDSTLRSNDTILFTGGKNLLEGTQGEPPLVTDDAIFSSHSDGLMVVVRMAVS